MSSPRISIVVPSFEQASFLDQALRSLIEQRYPDLEILVVDGGSQDGSVAIIERHAEHIAWWTSEPDDGQSDAINKGMARATGEVVGWLNSDDFQQPGALATVGAEFAAHPDADLLTGNGLRVDEGGRAIEPFWKVPVRIDVDALRYGLNYLLQPSTFVTTRAWRRVEGLRTDLQWGMDWDLWLRVLRDGPAIATQETLAASREYGSTKTSTGHLVRWEELRAIAREHSGLELTPGTLAYLFDSLVGYLEAEPRAAELMPGAVEPLRVAWRDAAMAALERLAGRVDGFPG